MSGFETVPEQAEAKRLLRAALAEGPAHAYLFHGPPGVGKRAAALAFAAQLIGEPPRVQRGAHPDVYVLELNLVVTAELLPDRTFLVLVDPEVAFQRTKASDRIEREGKEFHRAVDEAYRSLAEMFPDRIIPIDGNRNPDVVAEEIRGRVRELS